MIVAIINNKGGTGKTTTSVSLSAALADMGYRTLLVDLDSQASASLSLGIAREHLSPSMADLLFQFEYTDLTDIRRSAVINGLDILPGHIDLANTDLILANVVGREKRLSEILQGVKDEYDFIFLDCPPSLSMLSINALVAADGYMVPIVPEYLALEGLIGLMNGVDRMKNGMGIETELLGIVFTLMNPCLNISKEISGIIRDHYGNRVFETEIRRDVKLGEAPAYGKSVFEFAPKSKGAKAYALLAEEFMARCAKIGKGVSSVDNAEDRVPE
jgi:chromosome partitioning protein